MKKFFVFIFLCLILGHNAYAIEANTQVLNKTLTMNDLTVFSNEDNLYSATKTICSGLKTNQAIQL